MSCHGAAFVTMTLASVAMAVTGTCIAVAVSGEWTSLHRCHTQQSDCHRFSTDIYYHSSLRAVDNLLKT